MPFTTSHPAIILPLKKLFPNQVSLSGLIAGAMSPDLIYFLLNETSHRGLGHSWSGLFIVCIPLGILFTFAFHWLFKKQFIRNLPSPLDRYLNILQSKNYCPDSIKAWVILILSVLIGALSHFFWDSFTHLDGEMVQSIPILAQKSMIFGTAILNCTILQHLSSIIGALFFIIYLPASGLIDISGGNYKPRSTGAKFAFWFAGLIFVSIYVIIMTYQYHDKFIWNLPGIPTTTAGLSSWSGFFWYVVLVTIIKHKKRRIE